MVKNKICYSIEEQIIGTVETISKKRGVSASSIVERYLEHSLSKEVDLTAIQRYHHARNVFENKLMDNLHLHGIMLVEGSISDKMCILVGCLTTYRAMNKNSSRNGINEISLYELLNDISNFDKELFSKCLNILPRNMKKRYVDLYK